MALGITGSLSGRVLKTAKAGTQWGAALALGVLLSAAAAHAGPARIGDGKDLLRAMHDRYQHDWYQTLTFEQTSTTHNPDGSSKTEIWHEAAMLPGNLRVDFG